MKQKKKKNQGMNFYMCSKSGFGTMKGREVMRVDQKKKCRWLSQCQIVLKERWML